MATIRTAIQIQDGLSNAFRSMNIAMQTTINSFEHLQEASGNAVDTSSIEIARRELARAEAAFNGVEQEIREANAAQQEFNDSIRGGTNLASGLLKKIAGVAAAYIGINKVKDMASDLFSTGIDFHAFRQGANVAFTTFLGDAEKAKQYMDDMLAFAKTTPFAYPDLLTAGRNMIAFGMEADNTFAVVKAIGDATAAIGGSSQQLMDIADVFGAIQVSGSISMMEINRLHSHGIQALEMLSEKFGMTAEEMKKKISAGAISSESAIVALVEGIEHRFGGMMEELKGTWVGAIDSLKSARRNAGAELMDQFMEPLTDFIGEITDFFKRLPSLIGPGVQAFIPLVEIVGNAFETGKIDAFFYVLNIGLQVAAWVLTTIAQGVLWVVDVFTTYWPVILAGLSVLTAIYFPAILTYLNMMIIKLWLMIQPILAQAAAWAIANWPITLVILAVATLIAILYSFGISTEQIIGFVVGLFYILGAQIYNRIAFLWNIFAAVAEFWVNVWNHPMYTIKKLFYNLASNVLDQAIAMSNGWDGFATSFVNAIISAVNIAIRAWNAFIEVLPDGVASTLGLGKGTEFSHRTSITSDLQNLKGALGEWVGEAPSDYWEAPKTEMISLGDAWNAGYDRGANLLNNFDLGTSENQTNRDELLSSLDDGNQNGKDTAKNTKKLANSVDMAAEDLKYLRDIAEREAINRYTTAEINIDMKNENHINNEMDIDGIIDRFGERAEEVAEMLAEGV